jgi:transcriptional regulator of arginine metabolism
MSKQQRQFAIREIIARQTIASQEELSDALRQAGFDATQATLSRDLKDMGIARVSTPDGARYIIHAESEEHRLRSFMSYEIISIVANDSMIVVRTLPGRAQGVAELIDHLAIPEIIGTIAGDNTIFIAPAGGVAAADVAARLRDAVGTGGTAGRRDDGR